MDLSQSQLRRRSVDHFDLNFKNFVSCPASDLECDVFADSVDELGKYLRSLNNAMQDFCNAGFKMAKGAQKLSVLMQSSSSHLGDTNSKLAPSLLLLINRVGVMMDELASSQEMLCESLEGSFIEQIQHFISNELKDVESAQKTVKTKQEHHEHALGRYLHGGTVKLSQMNNMEQRAMDVLSTKRDFEVARFDFIDKINQVEALKTFQLTETAISTFYTLNTFFFQCHDMFSSNSSFIETVHEKENQMRAEYMTMISPREKTKTNLREAFDATVTATQRSASGEVFTTRSSTVGVPVQSTKSFIMTSRETETYTTEECEACLGVLDTDFLDPFLENPPPPPLPVPVASFSYSLGGSSSSDIIKQGYLWKKSSRRMMNHHWNRRWFVLTSSVLFYIKQEDGCQPHVVAEMVLASIRNASSPDTPFTFELTFGNKRTYTLQAEGQREYDAWVEAINKSVADQLTGGTESFHELSGLAASSRETAERIMRENPFCADCSAADPDWVSLNLGCVICIQCSGVHRSLGTHISKVRSLRLDSLDDRESTVLLSLGNQRVNSVFEADIPEDETKPRPDDDYATKAAFIRAKYQWKRFVAGNNIARGSEGAIVTPKHSFRSLWTAIQVESLKDVLQALAQGADANTNKVAPRPDVFSSSSSSSEEEEGGASKEEKDRALLSSSSSYFLTPLHVAVLKRNLSIVHMLVENGATVFTKDSDGRYPLDMARLLGFDEIVAYLQLYDNDGDDDDDDDEDEGSVRGGDVSGSVSPGKRVSVRQEREMLLPLDSMDMSPSSSDAFASFPTLGGRQEEKKGERGGKEEESDDEEERAGVERADSLPPILSPNMEQIKHKEEEEREEETDEKDEDEKEKDEKEEQEQEAEAST